MIFENQGGKDPNLSGAGNTLSQDPLDSTRKSRHFIVRIKSQSESYNTLEMAGPLTWASHLGPTMPHLLVGGVRHILLHLYLIPISAIPVPAEELKVKDILLCFHFCSLCSPVLEKISLFCYDLMLPAMGARPFQQCPVPPYLGAAQWLTLTVYTHNECIFGLFTHLLLGCFPTSRENLKVEMTFVGIKETVVVIVWEIFRLGLL